MDETRQELKALGFKEFCTFDHNRIVVVIYNVNVVAAKLFSAVIYTFVADVGA